MLKSIKHLVLLSFILTSLSRAHAQPAITWENDFSTAPASKGFVALRNGNIISVETNPTDTGPAIKCWLSTDQGKTWQDLGTITTAEHHVDLGDSVMIELQNGDLLVSYRRNRYRGDYQNNPEFNIETSISHDGGKTWSFHSTVAKSKPGKPGQGLWASTLHQRKNGTIQCYFDDEDTPYKKGYQGHQWVTMRTWNPTKKAWVKPVTVARTPNPKNLSRDGMPSITEWPSGRMMAVFEAVDPNPPHANLIAATFSTNGGKTWNWKKRRTIIHGGAPSKHLSISPWTARFGNTVVCVFATDEDRPSPGVSGTPVHKLSMDLKYAYTTNRGKTWSDVKTLYNQSGNIYKPSIAILPDGSSHNMLVMFLDIAANCNRSVRGNITFPKE
ncbi:sialidase family protein [Poriferisphaera sp. WC338]|uniref:sialidase family protein n=1 Tax=Poriferisphaera sp. WC338 TaxID=3425129 RepID=UPI003D815FA7